VVEHDEMMMRSADHIIDMGPLAAHQGGRVIAEGDYDEIVANPESLTGKYLSGALEVKGPAPAKRKKPAAFLVLESCRQFNLKDITVEFPLQTFCVVTGVSGSGKTTLVKQ